MVGNSYIPVRGIGMVQDPVQYPNEFIAEMNSLILLPGGGIFACGERAGEIYPGSVLARLTADVAGVGEAGQFIARKSALLTATAAMGANTLTVANPSMFKPGDTIVVDDGVDPADAEVISSVNLETGVITIVGTLSGSATDPLPIGSRVGVAASGQDTAYGLSRTRYHINREHPVVGQAAIIIGGIFVKNKLIGWDAAAATTLGAVDITGAVQGTLVNIKR